MIGGLSKLWRDERGGSIIEMALVAPFLCAMLIGMVDVSRATSMKLQTTQVAHRAIERLVAQPEVTDAVLKTEAATGAGVAESAVTIDRWLECNGVKSTAATCASGQTYARYVTISIAKTYTALLSSRFSKTLNGKAGLRTQ